MDKINALLAKVQAELSGEPLRFITYGALAVVWLVTHLLFALGIGAQPPSFDVILVAITAAIAALNETIRLFVSPATPPAPAVPAVPSGDQGVGPVAS